MAWLAWLPEFEEKKCFSPLKKGGGEGEEAERDGISSFSISLCAASAVSYYNFFPLYHLLLQLLTKTILPPPLLLLSPQLKKPSFVTLLSGGGGEGEAGESNLRA